MIFYLTFVLLGKPLQLGLASIIQGIETYVRVLLENIQVSQWLLSLIQNGIFAGIGNVLSFLPIILILFFCLSLLEDSGYMARIAFLMDRLLWYVGLSGHSIVPLLIGFGCSVPAIMACRTLVSEQQRKKLFTIIPFISCSAKLPIYGMVIAVFYPTHTILVLLMLYTLGIVVAVVAAWYLKVSGVEANYVLELPPYRFPSMKNALLQMGKRAKEFVTKAFTTLLLCSILIWFGQNMNFTLSFVTQSDHSILAILGGFLAPLFKPLGFSDWRIVAALLAGIGGKESVVSTLSVLMHSENITSFSQFLPKLFTPLSAFSFLVFTLLYMPCVAAFSVIRRELGSWKEALKISLLQTMIAYFLSMCIYQMASILVGG